MRSRVVTLPMTLSDPSHPKLPLYGMGEVRHVKVAVQNFDIEDC